jgi:TonB-dependent starch-binding outer membrane protein SusC
MFRLRSGKRYGNFYSISGAWKIQNEDFMKNLPLFSELKLRGGYGVIGNSSNSDYLYYSSVNPNATYIFGNTSIPGAALAGVVDPNLHWEQTQETNLGIDWSILSNKVYGSIDAYNRFTKDVLASIPIALSAGSDRDLFTNLASLRNKGVEILVGYRNNQGKIQYNINANFGLLKNEVVSLGGANPIYGGQPINDGQHDRVSLTKEGGSVGDFWLIPTSGILKSNEQLATYQKLVPAAQLGDLIYQDTNGDGKLDDNDRVNLGSPIPKYEFGLNLNANYKNFDVSLFLAGQAGHKIYNAFKYAAIWAGAHYDNILSWTPANTASNIPRMDENNAHNNTRAISDRYLESGDYLRIKNFQVGYTFPDKVFGKTGISKLRIYLSSQNLLTFTKYTSFDPEAGNDGLFNRGVDQGLYPQGRLFQAGLNLNF